MILSEKFHPKAFILVLALSIALIFCNVLLCSISFPEAMSGHVEHTHMALVGCALDSYGIATSMEVSWFGKIVGFILLLSLLLGAGISGFSPGESTSLGYLLIHGNHRSNSTNKLYKLHATYLI